MDDWTWFLVRAGVVVFVGTVSISLGMARKSLGFNSGDVFSILLLVMACVYFGYSGGVECSASKAGVFDPFELGFIGTDTPFHTYVCYSQEEVDAYTVKMKHDFNVQVRTADVSAVRYFVYATPKK